MTLGISGQCAWAKNFFTKNIQQIEPDFRFIQPIHISHTVFLHIFSKFSSNMTFSVDPNYKSSGKLTMLRDDYDEFLAWCKAQGIPFYKLTVPSIVVSYANEGERTHIDELKKVKFTKRSHKATQGDKSLSVDIDMMIVGGIVTDGLEPA